MLRRLTSPIARLCLLGVALAFSFVAHYLFTDEWLSRINDTNGWDWPARYSMGLGCVIMALALAALAAWLSRRSWSEVWREPMALTRSALVAVFAAVGLYLLATILYLITEENSAVRLMWVGSWIVLSVGLWKIFPPARQLWPSKRELLAIGGLTFIACGLRFWQLTTIPDQLDNDVFWIGTVAHDLVETSNYNWIGFSAPASQRHYYPDTWILPGMGKSSCL